MGTRNEAPALMGVLGGKVVPLFWIPGLVPPLRWFLRGLRAAGHPEPAGTLGGAVLPPSLCFPSPQVGWGREGAGAQHRLAHAHSGGHPDISAGQPGPCPLPYSCPPSPPTVMYGPCVTCIYCAFSHCLGVGGRGFSLKGGYTDGSLDVESFTMSWMQVIQ